MLTYNTKAGTRRSLKARNVRDIYKKNSKETSGMQKVDKTKHKKRKSSQKATEKEKEEKSSQKATEKEKEEKRQKDKQ